MSPSRVDAGTSRKPSRRGLLKAAALALGAAAVQGSAVQGQTRVAQTKAQKEEADYQPTPKNGLSCAVCSLYRPPKACEVVAGDIDPHGWCKFFDLPD